ncbi:uncharacterized protein LOC119672758 isoform X1 [Teleopsis dalmanni]|uniref:uncharacterized protein LOC119672758 isoform X1 n=1 Tax=Teleopsis dalmanni TaxID=139649 RepID=UPI0018CF632C|nr:uncharacterized protein LOC119672758 isoform X1 [Teleopsis dalmanni]
MRAHFAGDVISHESVDRIEQDSPSLEERIEEFKRDSKKMEELEEFINDVLTKAEAEAIKKQSSKHNIGSQQTKEKTRQSFTIPDFKNGKVVNRARGFVVRIFDAICNCANTAAAPAQRIKLRAKRAQSAAAAAVNRNTNATLADENGEKMDLKEAKVKKQDKSKDKLIDKKKDDKIQQEEKMEMLQSQN